MTNLSIIHHTPLKELRKIIEERSVFMKNISSMTDFQMCCAAVVVCYSIKRIFDYLNDKEVMMTYNPSTDQVDLLTSKN